jgi:hypothetical protein
MIFFSIDEAAVAALAEAKACSQQRRECGGYIYEMGPNQYSYTAPVTSGKVSSVDLSGVYSLNWRWVADYHTHVCVGVKPLVEVFSMQDVLSNKGLHIAGYMLSLCTGYVRRWAEGDPEDDFEVDYHSGRKLYLATGHIVGTVPIAEKRDIGYK